MSISVTRAETFKSYCRFIEDWDRKKNISYHLQYIEFLYKIKKIHNPSSTTRSLLHKSIIIEYFTVIEAIIDALLCQLKVKVNESNFVPIDIEEYTNAQRLLELAKKYKIIDSDMHSQLGQIKNTRNKIHIKRRQESEPLEYARYTVDELKKHEKIFNNFLAFLFQKYDIDYSSYPWPLHEANNIQ